MSQFKSLFSQFVGVIFIFIDVRWWVEGKDDYVLVDNSCYVTANAVCFNIIMHYV